MFVYTLENKPALIARINWQPEATIVACFCAAWCDQCGNYKAIFNEVASQNKDHIFVWIDIEDNPEYLGTEDIENFPTICVQNGSGNLFFGAQLPFASHLQGLIQTLNTQGAIIDQGPPLIKQILAN